jgi:hypothetical protein
MSNQALKFYMHDGANAFRFELAGKMNRDGARELDQCWRTASAVIGVRRLMVDMTFVTDADEWGRALLARWHREGARLIANSASSRALAESILGEPLREPPHTGVTVASDWTWRPFRTSYVAPAVYLLLLLAVLLFPTSANAAKLNSETVAAWDDYLQTVNASLQRRVGPGGSFLWTFENSERLAKVLSGEIVVAPAPGENPKRVPGGLIHHWMGAVFLPHLRLDDVIEVTRDYGHFKEYYRPSVIESKVIARDGAVDKFSMQLMNKAFFLKTALDTDYQATNRRLDDRRYYSIARTTRVQEIVECGQDDQRRIPEGEGSGYIWKLYSVARFAERDGGVYVELEAIALSRQIPAAVRLFADPIVRRVSRNSLLTSLQQTDEAVRGRFAMSPPAGVSASAEQLRSVPASLSKQTFTFTRTH